MDSMTKRCFCLPTPHNSCVPLCSENQELKTKTWPTTSNSTRFFYVQPYCVFIIFVLISSDIHFIECFQNSFRFVTKLSRRYTECIYACVYTHTHIHIHTYTHTHTILTYTQPAPPINIPHHSTFVTTDEPTWTYLHHPPKVHSLHEGSLLVLYILCVWTNL